MQRSQLATVPGIRPRHARRALERIPHVRPSTRDVTGSTCARKKGGRKPHLNQNLQTRSLQAHQRAHLPRPPHIDPLAAHYYQHRIFFSPPFLAFDAGAAVVAGAGAGAVALVLVFFPRHFTGASLAGAGLAFRLACQRPRGGCGGLLFDWVGMLT